MSERRILVCSVCLRASCWHGEFLCDRSLDANIVWRTEKELDELGLEHPSHYSREKIRKVYGWDPGGRAA